MAISITKPTVGGSEDTWGTQINTALDTIVDGVNGTSGTIAPDLSTLTINGTDVTATAAELNILDGVTATTAEINHVDGVTSNIQTQLDSKAIEARTITAGAGLTGGGSLSADRIISHADTSSQSSVSNSGNTVIQDVTLDTYGHVTGLTSTTIPTYTAPSTAGAVGTYAVGRPANGTTYAVGDTVSGILAPRTTRSYWSNTYSTFYEPTYAGYTLSGTWRTMTPVHGSGIGLWIRIS